MARSGRRRFASSPLWLVGVGLGLSLLLLGVVGMVTIRMHERASAWQQLGKDLDASLNRIEHAGTLASLHRSMAIRTGDSLWIGAHRQSAEQLIDEIDRARSFARTPSSRAGLARADSINRLIIAEENEAIALALDGDHAAARARIESPEFAHLISSYVDALLYYARASDDAGQLANARNLLEALETELANLPRAGRPRGVDGPIASYVGVVRARLVSVAGSLQPYLGAEAVDRVTDAFDSLVHALERGDEAVEEQAAVHEAVAALSSGAQYHQARLENEVRWRSRVVAILYLALGALLVVLWVFIVGMIRRALAERDIVERRLRQSDARNAALLSAVPDMIFVLDRDGRYVDFSAPAKEAPLAPPESFLGKTVYDVMPEEFADLFHGVFERAVQLGRASFFEYDLEKDGRRLWYEAWIAPEGDERILVVVRDITERRQAAAAVREGEVRFRALVENSLVGTYIVQEDEFVYVNPRFAEIFGRPQSDFVGRRMWDVIRGADSIVEALNDPEATTLHTTMSGDHVDGHPITVEVFASAAEIDGEPAIIGALLDVTERERTRAKIAALKTFYEETLNRLPIEVAVLDRSLRYQYLNPTAVPDAGRRASLVGKSLEAMGEIQGIDAERIAVRRQWLEHVMGSGTHGHIEDHVRGASGEPRHLLRVAAPVRDEHGEVLHVVTYALDITERKQYEAKLLDAKERAEEMARLKSAFLANMSHEIRTPLTGILGFASLLEDEVPEAQRPFASLILRSGKRLLDTLNAVLDLSRLEAGEMQLEARAIDIGAETAEIASFLHALSAEKRLELRVEIPNQPVVCYVDPSAFHIILNNLLGNAIKFTDAGSVSVRISRDGERGVLQVEDTGVGIDEGFLPQLFEEFKQESVGLTRTHEGSGLGLAITRRLVEMSRGTIEVRTEKGRGSVFTVTLPLVPEQLNLAFNGRTDEATKPELQHVLDQERPS